MSKKQTTPKEIKKQAELLRFKIEIEEDLKKSDKAKLAEFNTRHGIKPPKKR
ncbi:hypothetical protein Hs30E_20540 [Lactococcus hodotermopsidis]|uniref:Uncharacterized protein n=1 Tax=Pseudolactococcus hodotermopsidis TaxID=2709157 RepID=A0A6A0BIC8_9LACT|nr:hypothetical protein [Lactococcus hodotermopsidis]GFH43507.1 hypothetical protein Hs30E_20540 [Lactococcus hodotermopsidis]